MVSSLTLYLPPHQPPPHWFTSPTFLTGGYSYTSLEYSLISDPVNNVLHIILHAQRL